VISYSKGKLERVSTTKCWGAAKEMVVPSNTRLAARGNLLRLGDNAAPRRGVRLRADKLGVGVPDLEVVGERRALPHCVGTTRGWPRKQALLNH